MIVEETFYAVKCNRCKKMHDDGEHSFWSDESSAVEMSMNSDWIDQDNKHYCPNCYETTENDLDVVKEPYPEHLVKLQGFCDSIMKGTPCEVNELNGMFKVRKSLHGIKALHSWDENYIRSLLGEYLISIVCVPHERFNLYECFIDIKK